MAKNHIIVIGAGIQGAGVAQAAAAAGYRVTVLEKNQIGGATSSNSSKLIHGGLRYLESAQFSLVRECLHERQLLLSLAPDLISLERFHIPIYANSTRSRWHIRAGLALYGLLSGCDKSGRFGEIPKQKWGLYQGLKQEQLRSLHYYYDAQTNDQALTQSVMQSAKSLGAELILGADVDAIALHSNGCSLQYQYQGRSQQLEADAIVNCSGPWVNELLAKVTPTQQPLNIELIQGSHLLLENTGINDYYYLESPQDKRAFFALPYYDSPKGTQQLLVGTTETPFTGKPENAQCTAEEERYLLANLHHYFPDSTANIQIKRYFCGLRVLPKADRKTPFSRHRETLYQLDQATKPRLISVAGGKLTSYRLSALQVLERLSPTLNTPTPIAETDQLPLYPCD